MRQTTISNITVTYPDAIAWLHDNITVTLEGTLGNQKVGADITVTNTATGGTRTLRYLSELNTLVFPLNDTFMSLRRDDSTYNVVVKLYNGALSAGSFGFDTDVVNGQTLPLRRHGSTRTIYAYSSDDLRKIRVYYPASGAVSVGGCSFLIPYEGIIGLDLRGCVTSDGVWSMCYSSEAKDSEAEHVQDPVEKSTHGYISIVDVNSITTTSAVAQLWFADTSGEVDPNSDKGGGVWNDEKFPMDSYCIRLVYEEPCDTGFDFFKVRYTDTDGCLRYLGGKILEQTTGREAENYYRLDADSVLHNISRKHTKSSNGTVKVGYDSLRRDSYWTDILLSDKVEFLNYNGDWVECSVVSDEVTVTSSESEDVTIEYELFAN